MNPISNDRLQHFATIADDSNRSPIVTVHREFIQSMAQELQEFRAKYTPPPPVYPDWPKGTILRGRGGIDNVRTLVRVIGPGGTDRTFEAEILRIGSSSHGSLQVGRVYRFFDRTGAWEVIE